MKQKRDDERKGGRDVFAAFWGSAPSWSCASRPDFRAMWRCGGSPRND